MEAKLKILHLEDSTSDAELVNRLLKKSELDFETLLVDNREEFVSALNGYMPDVILSDHSLPSFNSYDALTIIQETGMKIPFILITANVSEEFAVDVIKKGADDYILKDRLQRLPSAIFNALEKYRLELRQQSYLAELIRKERHYRVLIESGSDAILILDRNGQSTYASPSVQAVLGYSESEILDINILDRVHPFDKRIAVQKMDRCLKEPGIPIAGLPCRFKNKQGDWVWLEGTLTNMLHDLAINGIIDNFRNVTDRVQAEHVLRKSEKKYRAEREQSDIRLTDLNDDLEIYTKELVISNKELEQFSYIISHNLRAPVANIMALIEQLKDDSHSLEVKEILNSGLSTSVELLNDVITDLNTILKVKKEIDEKKEMVKLSDLIANIQASIQNIIERDGVQVITDFSELDEILTLKSYLYSIFYNLISNSIKFAQPGLATVIKIHSEVSDEKLVIIFEDNGIGIDLGKKGDQVFGLYKRFHQHIEGKGMGLFMVKTQVETLGGKITISSNVNAGTRFKIEFN